MAKKICIVDSDFADKRIGLSQYLIKAGYHVTIVGSSKKKFPDTITYVFHDLKRHFSITSDYKSYKWYKNFFAKNEFDIIHTFNTKPSFLVPLALLKTKTPITRTINGLGKIFMSRSVFNVILTKIYLLLHLIVKNRVNKTIFQNSDDKEFFLKNSLINSSNYNIISSSGIDLKSINAVAQKSNNQFTFICVSRILFQKGILNYLEAAKICIVKGFDLKFLLVGPLEENSNTLNENILAKYSQYVKWLNHRDDVINLLSQSDAFVLPTFYGEGFPRVLLEAAAVGLPIISTNVTGVREFGENGRDLILIEPKDSPLLADTMIEIATNKNLAEKLAENSLKQVQNFSLEKVSSQYIDTFNKILSKV